MSDPLVLTADQHIGEGAFGSVFRVGDRAIKVFGKPRDIMGRPWDDPDEIHEHRKVYEAELDAYVIAMRDPEIRQHVPAFFGPVAVADIIGSHGKSSAGAFMLDCAFSIAFVEGTPIDLYDPPEHVRAFFQRMHDAGIRRTNDCIGWRVESATDFVVADFATHDAAEYWQMARQGVLVGHPPPRPAPWGSEPTDT